MEIEKVELSQLEDTLSEAAPRGLNETLRRIREEADTDMHIQLRIAEHDLVTKLQALKNNNSKLSELQQVKKNIKKKGLKKSSLEIL